jgi:hypothetical protein
MSETPRLYVAATTAPITASTWSRRRHDDASPFEREGTACHSSSVAATR